MLFFSFLEHTFKFIRGAYIRVYFNVFQCYKFPDHNEGYLYEFQL